MGRRGAPAPAHRGRRRRIRAERARRPDRVAPARAGPPVRGGPPIRPREGPPRSRPARHRAGPRRRPRRAGPAAAHPRHRRPDRATRRGRATGGTRGAIGGALGRPRRDPQRRAWGRSRGVRTARHIVPSSRGHRRSGESAYTRTTGGPRRSIVRRLDPRGGLMAAKILIVDDDPNVQRLLQYTLKQEGYDTVVAGDGAEGFRLWGAEAPDLILLDVMLPKLDGYQVAAKIRSEEGGSAHVPIIMLTAEREVEQKVRGLRAGADDYLIKPFHPAELLARIKSLLALSAPRDTLLARPPMGRVLAFYGAKGGVGTTTIAIHAAIALHGELGRKVALVDGNLQFGDHRVFLALGLDRKSIADLVTAPTIDVDLVRQVMVKHDSGIDLLLAPPTPETAELVHPEHLPVIASELSSLYDYTLVDVDKRLDDVNLGVSEAAESVFVVMTADLSCLKNVRLIIETMDHLGYPADKLQLVLNRSNAFTGINVKSAEGALKRTIEHQIVNEYRGAISALNTGDPFMFTKADSSLGASLLHFARAVDKQTVAAAEPARVR